MANIHRRRLMASLDDLLHSSKYSDLTIHCGSEEWRVHRNIVCQRSDFFAAACDGEILEAKTQTILLDDDDGVTVQRMLTYLYTLDYDDGGDAGLPTHYMLNGCSGTATTVLDRESALLSEDEATRHLQLMNNVVVYAMAEKYNIAELKELAKAKFSKALNPLPLTLNLPPIVDAIFGTTPNADCGLRGTIISMAADHAKEILNDESSHCMFKEHGELGLGMLQQLLPQLEAEKEVLRRDVATSKQHIQSIFERAAELTIPESNSPRLQRWHAETKLRDFTELIDSYKTPQR